MGWLEFKRVTEKQIVCYNMGRASWDKGIAYKDCPYVSRAFVTQWQSGWLDARRASGGGPHVPVAEYDQVFIDQEAFESLK